MFFELDSQNKSRKKRILCNYENKCEPSFEALVNISATNYPSDSQSVFTILVIVQIHRLNVCSTSKYVKGSSGVVLGFKEDDGDVMDFDNIGEVVRHKLVSQHFLVTNIHFYLSPVSRSEC